jgi:CBS domain-containing protein
MQIKEIMTHAVVSCPVSATTDAAARLMWEFDCGMVPVLDDDGRLAGVITDRDICMAAYTQGVGLAAIPVTSVMARQVVAAHLEDTVESVESLMQTSQIRRVPILDRDNRVAGIIAVNDLTRLAARAHRNGVDRGLIKTMAAVCEPRAHAPMPAPEAAAPPIAV